MRNQKMLLVIVLFMSICLSGFQAPVFAEQVDDGVSVTVFGTDEDSPLASETVTDLVEGETATETLLKAIGEENVEFTESNFGRMITSIKGVAAEGTNFWSFYINGIEAQVGSDVYQVQPGDHLSFRYIDWTKPSENTVGIEVVDKNGTKLNDVTGIRIVGTPTAFQLLQVMLGTDKVEYADTDYGKMITSINGISAEGTFFWSFYVNGQSAMVGADSYPLQTGDLVSFKYVSWEEAPAGNENEPSPPVSTIPEQEIDTAVHLASQYVLNQEITEWEAIALKGAGKAIPASYLEKLKQIVIEKQGKFNRITDIERYVLGILAAGGDPTNIAGYNLVEAIYNGNVVKQGLNGVAYGLIALDSANFEIPQDAEWTREKLVDYLLTRQNDDGGWNWNETVTSDIDTTAMVLTALAPYVDQKGITERIESAVNYLSTQYGTEKIDNSSSAAQVIIALSALGIDANGALFSRDNIGLVQFLLSFQNQDGGFDWQGGDVSDIFSTQQGFQAVVAYQLFTQEKGSLYSIPVSDTDSDHPVTEKPEETDKPVIETPNEESAAPVSPSNEDDTKENAGYPLPNTAGNVGNLIAVGILFLLIGSLYYWTQNRRKA